MKIVNGKHNNAKVYTSNIEEEAIAQIKQLCDLEVFSDGKIRIMPDVHAGKGCVIGFTADLGDKVIPNIVGVDIGCGMLTIELGSNDLDLQKLDEIINNFIPHGYNIHNQFVFDFKLEINKIHCIRDISKNGWSAKKWTRQVGTLGSGNHFIEIGIDSENNKYLVIHSGSRNLGKRIAEYYQNLAIDICSGKEDYFIKREQIIKEYKSKGKRKEIQNILKELKKKYDELTPDIPRDLCFLTGGYRDRYLHDMKICQDFAQVNRESMANIILEKLLGKNIEGYSYWHTIHNYIDFDSNIIRKGAIRANVDEKILIPLNMRDGSLICKGKGNNDWNCSAPHGAGRIMSRRKAKEILVIEDFVSTMEGIYSSSVCAQTLDEAPMAYKPMQEIVDNIGETADIIEHIKPIYNFKSK